MDAFRRLYAEGVALRNQGILPGTEERTPEFKEFRSRCLSALAVYHQKGDKLYKELKYIKGWEILDMLLSLSNRYDEGVKAHQSGVTINFANHVSTTVNVTIQQSDLSDEIKGALESLVDAIEAEKSKVQPDESFLKKHWKDIIELGMKAVSVANACGAFK